ncbi:hypothetical protein FGO68_gene5363 [Halteria grandinella]|uniref:Transmembrane protein n=1 Tax=Halteria grandinella TaxID=5974 RepID=A0A8J8P885_HALGN|nr:hypothetical protein FGO68_gene5363 [Halteria grandinella]
MFCCCQCISLRLLSGELLILTIYYCWFWLILRPQFCKSCRPEIKAFPEAIAAEVVWQFCILGPCDVARSAPIGCCKDYETAPPKVEVFAGRPSTPAPPPTIFLLEVMSLQFSITLAVVMELLELNFPWAVWWA